MEGMEWACTSETSTMSHTHSTVFVTLLHGNNASTACPMVVLVTGRGGVIGAVYHIQTSCPVLAGGRERIQDLTIC